MDAPRGCVRQECPEISNSGSNGPGETCPGRAGFWNGGAETAMGMFPPERNIPTMFQVRAGESERQAESAGRTVRRYWGLLRRAFDLRDYQSNASGAASNKVRSSGMRALSLFMASQTPG
jgi:hypothetical protein